MADDKTAIKLLDELGVLEIDILGKMGFSCRLFPKEFQSETSVNKKTCIGKVGNRYIREALYMGALSAARHDPNVRAFYLHLITDNGFTKLQAICAVMRKMILAIHAMFKYQKPFNGQCFYKLDNIEKN